MPRKRTRDVPLSSPSSSSRQTRSKTVVPTVTEGDADERAKKLSPKVLNFENISAERLEKGSFEGIVGNFLVSFGNDVSGKPREPPRIPLCRLMTMEAVQTLQQASLHQMKTDFIRNGYVDKFLEFHISETNAQGQRVSVSDFIEDWDPLWKAANEEFERECDEFVEFHELKHMMFWVFDGNHRLNAWTQVAAEYPHDPKYHPRVRFSLLKPGECGFRKIEQAMHGLNA